MAVRSTWLAPTGQTREDTRLTQLGATTPVDPLRVRSGILPGSAGGTYRVSGFSMQGTSAMAATVRAGRAVVQGPSAQGAYPVTLDQDLTLTFADGHAQYARTDLVCLRVYDQAYDTSGLSQATVEIVQGTPQPLPVAPTTPELALPLYYVAVPAGTSAGTGGITWAGALTDLRVTTVAVGGILPAYGDATAAGAYPGQYKDLDGVLYRWDGTAWVPYGRALGGIVPNGALTTGSYTGQYRDGTGGVLQRWDGTTWQYAEGRATVLLSASQTMEQGVSSGVWTAIILQTKDVDDANGWNGSNAYTVPRTGWWRVSGTVAWYTQSTTGSRGVRISVNGTGIPRATRLIGAGPGATSVSCDCLVRLTAGDSLQLFGFQNSGVAIQTLGGSGYYSNLTAEWIKS